jgi:signal transduction histidine kinase
MTDHHVRLHQRHGLWWTVAFALTAALAAAVTTALAQRIASETVYAFYIGAVAVTAWGAGRPAAIAVVVMCSALAAGPFLNVGGAGGIAGEADAVRIASFAAVALLVAHLTGALRHARNSAERLANAASKASSAKDRFLATMSHEFRTPLNAVLAYTDLMLDGVAEPLSPKQRDFTDRIRSAGAHLLVLVEDILNLEKMEAGHLTVEESRVRLREVVERAGALVEPQARAKGVALELAPPRDEVVCFGDSVRIQQIVVNLLANAIKFTNRGGKVSATWGVEHEPGGMRACIKVMDTGVGIAPGDQTRIFEPFEQVLDGPVAVSAGAGLGLAISQRLARAMAGTLSVSSRIGHGSTFTLSLPCVAARPGPGG